MLSQRYKSKLDVINQSVKECSRMYDSKNSQLHLVNTQIHGLKQYKTSEAIKEEQFLLFCSSPSSLKHGWQPFQCVYCNHNIIDIKRNITSEWVFT